MAGRAALLAAGLLFSLVLLETGIRYAADRRQGDVAEEWKIFSAGGDIAPRSRHPLAAITRISPNKRIVYELKPGVQMDFGGFPLAINAAGMRESREYPAEKPPFTVRIVGIGDSGMFGWDVNQGEEYLSILESNLNARATGTVFEAINMAVPGYNTRQELEILRERGVGMKPDVVVVGWCENDFGLPFFMYTRKNHWRTDVSYLYCLLFARKRYAGLLEPDVVKAREMDDSDIASEILADRGPEGMRRTLTELKALSAEHGFKILFFGPMHKEIREICRDAGIEYCNTLDELPPDKYPKKYWIHRMHPKPEGHKILGEHLARVLVDKGFVPGPEKMTGGE